MIHFFCARLDVAHTVNCKNCTQEKRVGNAPEDSGRPTFMDGGEFLHFATSTFSPVHIRENSLHKKRAAECVTQETAGNR